jgi:hypothetical protein
MKKISINLEKIKNLKLTPNQYLYLACKITEVPLWFGLSSEEFDDLQDNGYIKNTNKGEVIRMKAIKLINDSGIVSDDEVGKLVDDYRALFPTGVKTSGYPVKGDRNACIKKMKIFLANNDFTPQEILEATRAYLAIQKKNMWKATQLSHYYIEKDNVSNLANMCEDIRDNGKPIDKGAVGTVEGV